MFSTPLFAADDDHAKILKELLIDHLSEKELEVCGWVFNDAYPYTLQKLPNNHFYAVVGSDGRCEYGHGSDEESAFNDCEKWKKENGIPGTCKPFAIGKEIVWEESIKNTGKSSVVSNKSGCIQGNCENGQGTFIWDNGDQYVGAWKDGKPHGEGTFDWRNRTKFVGEWRDGKKHGYGTHSFQDGSNHIGKWKNGKKHGWIMSTGGNMGVQVYEWKDGVRGEWLGNLNWEYVFNDNPYADGNIITNKDPTTLQNLVFVEEKLIYQNLKF